jgi:hypothetical protein
MAKKQYIKIGAAWSKSRTNDKGTFEYITVAFSGKQEKDEYEVILRRKSDGQEMALWNAGVSLMKNSYKKTEKQPDYIVSVGYETEE